ncbi:MAG: sialate O-acetylesterase [Thermoguttaceae bacterium]
MARIFSDHMVLQRDRLVPVWGWAAPGESVTVAFAGQTRHATADAKGRWRITLDSLPANASGRDMVVATVGATPRQVTVKEVLVGEVWFTAGQSNMMMGLGGAVGGADALKRIEACPHLWVANIPGQESQATEPLPDLKQRVSWSKPHAGYSAVSGFFAEKLYRHLGGHVPVGMITAVAIVPAESWVDASSLSAAPELAHLLKSPLGPSKWFNGIIAPLGPLALRGVLYYQGEYNGGRGAEFRALFPALIRSWRGSLAQPDLPFLFVQLPGYQDHRAGKESRMDMDAQTLAALHREGGRHGFTEVREAQLMTWLSVPRTGMAVTIDVGDAWDIHPADKEPVADRLLLQARQVAYGEKLVASGPVPTGARFRQRDVIVRFDHVGDGLVGKGPGGVLEGFDLAGPDRRFHSAQARIEGDTVVVSSPQVSSPAMLHYAWAGYPRCTLYNREGLPATPFRYYEPHRLPMPDSASFPFRNASFEQAGVQPHLAAEWGAQGQPVRQFDKASDGKAAIVLSGEHTGVMQDEIVAGLGYAWNCDPIREHAVRPGCVAGYSVDIAAGMGDGPATGYMRLCQDSHAGGYQAWGIPLISTAGQKFVRRHVAHRLSAEHIVPGSAAGTLFANHDGKRPVYLDNLSAVTVLRPMLKLSDGSTIDLGTARPGKQMESKPRAISNGQTRALPQLLHDGEEAAPVATILYGLAGAANNGWNHLQVLTKATDHVGAVLTGPSAERFEFVSEHRGATPRELKLIGPDGQPGLVGGQRPESEPLIIRFLGADRPGEYAATVRIVTQAGNAGVLSFARPGEPPVNLYYVDIPVHVKVE